MTKKWTVKDVKDKLGDDILDLSLCDMDEVPVKEIAQVRRFTQLDLSNNALVALPKTFATLTQIVKLDLSKNMLTEIPENIGELRMLRHLDLYSNQISRLPLSLGNLKHLKWLDLKENPLTQAVATVAGPCSNANECQACAKKIVLYLKNVRATIEEEKQRRLAAAEETEKTVNSKKESKKKRKAEKRAAERALASAKKDAEAKNNEPTSPEETMVDKYAVKTKNSNGFCALFCCVFASLITLTFLFALLAVVIFVVFPHLDEQRSDIFFKYVETRTGLPFKQYHYQGVRLSESFIVQAKTWTNHIRGYLKKTYQEYFFEETAPKKKF